VKLLIYPIAVVIIFAVSDAGAQHEHHTQSKSDTSKTGDKRASEGMNRNKSAYHDHSSMKHADSSMAPMSHSYSLSLPMNRNGSGTGWLTDSSPMYGYMLHSKKWMYMFHGNIFIRYNNQDISNKGSRGDTKVDVPSWFMAMGQRRIGNKGLFHFNAMFSLDPIFGGDGYPLLFQTGETFEGKPLVDRQHPHDLFSELSIAYTQSLTKDIDAFVYFGYPGEPALGPVAFMHRPSSLNNPDASLGHHWQDATHITFGVATVGFRYKIFKLDASIFTGREPNEERYDFDEPKFDSYSYRLTVNPTSALSLQVSRAFIKSPEELHPDDDVWRTTASITHVQPLIGENRFLSSTVIWGYNDSDHQENSFTIEPNLQLDKFAIYGRYEWIEKSNRELLVEELDENAIFNINALTLGLNYTILRRFETNFAIGVQGSVYLAQAALDPFYGNNPMSLEVYIRVSPSLMRTM
jgi:hypothetical protein